ncbi:MAG TPA: FecR domain-containing protein [Polyangiaceae bacterium]|nr:FecR domain-containing protein [Polyangiaceae bacterium]
MSELQDLLAPLREESEPPRRTVNREAIVDRMVEVSLAPEERFSSRARWFGALALAASVALAAWGGASYWRHAAPGAGVLRVSALRGNVSGSQGALGVGQTRQLDAQGSLETSPGAEARIETSGGLQIDLLENTRVSLAELGAAHGSAALRLERGRVRCVIEHRPERAFEVVTPAARIIDVGTVFSVTVDPASAVTVVHVEEGAVQVLHAGAQTRLNAAQTWSSASEPAPVVAQEPAAAPSEPELAPSARREPARRRTPTLALETELLQSGLRSEQQGDLRAAESSLKALVTRYPASPLAPDARAALSRVRSRLESSK